jgi:serine/threonine protein kinase
MSAPGWHRVKEIFQDMLDLAPDERAKRLREVCGDDRALQTEVESLLAAHARAGSFSDWPMEESLALGSGVRALASGGRVLQPGDHLGVYEIQSLVGVGGMGAVFKARDSRLDRDVAIKVLPPIFTTDPDRLVRFEREARLLAALNHPNIAAIYDIEEAADVRALVLEFVEGATLAERLKHSAMAIPEALPLARQIAEALEAAHEKGIVHRDLKPANVKVTPAGGIKVLDFGLAKAGGADGTRGLPGLPTSTIGGTGTGVLLGTARYMSPEQARGQPVDKRTDIWAFGCVLYEMLTGRAVFAGETAPDHIAAVLDREPDWSALPSGTPTAVRRLLRRCLEKDVKRRLPDIAVAKLEIDEPADDAIPAAESIHRWPGAIWTATTALAAVALTVVAVAGLIRRDRPSDTITLDFNAPSGSRFLAIPGVAISPDGQQVVFPAIPAEAGKSGSELGREGPGLRHANGSRARESRQALLHIRALSSPTARPLVGTDGGGSPFWSPDGRFVGFVSNGVLKKIAVIDGAVTKLADDANGRATWSSAGVVVFSGTDGRLHRVSENGGATTIVSELDESQGEEAHAWPVFLPDGRRFMYLARSSTDLARSVVYLSSIDSTARTRLFGGDTSVEYASGYLLYRRTDRLVAQRFDASTAQLTGDPTPIIDGIANEPLSGGAAVSVSENGVMIYGRGQGGSVVGGLGALTWFDRSGRESHAITSPGYYRYASVSPDGRRVAVTFSADGQ